MAKFLLKQLLGIVANVRKEAERILENLESHHRVALTSAATISFVICAGLLFPSDLYAKNANYCNTCPRDKHGHIKRSQTAKHEFMKSYPCPATGKSTGACPGYVIDHITSLKRGGADAPSNMQWQTVEEAKTKDKIE